MAKLNYQSRGVSNRRTTGGEASMQEFLPALILTGIGLAGLLIYALLNAGPAGSAYFMMLIGVVTLIQVVLGIGSAFLVATIMGSSFGELRSAGVKLAGIILFCAALGVWLPAGGGLVVLFIYLGLLMLIFGLQMYEAVVFSIVFFVVRLAVAILIGSMIQ